MAVMPASSQTKTSKVGRSQLTVTTNPQGGITGPLGDSDISSSKVEARRSQRATRRGIKRPLPSPSSSSGSADTLEEGNKLALLQNFACLPDSSSVLLHEGGGLKDELKATPGNAVTVGGECLTSQSPSSSSSDAENGVLEEEDEDYPKAITVQLAHCRLPYRWAEPPPQFKSCLSGQPLRSNDLESPGGVLRGAIRGDILGEVGDDWWLLQLPNLSYLCLWLLCIVVSILLLCAILHIGILAFFSYDRPGPFPFCEELS